MKKYFVDESGYTGTDLLNKDQRYQAASAISISENDAVALKRHFFPSVKSGELKYGSLSRRQSYQQPLFELQQAILENYQCCTCICDKKFMLIMLYMDFAVEPFYYDGGVDFYLDGQNYGMGSLVYYAAEHLLGEGNFEDVLNIFQQAMRSKTDVAINCLVEKVKNTRWSSLPECFGPIAQGYVGCIEAIKTPEVTCDIALPIILSLINRLEADNAGEYGIIHDTSRNMERYNDFLLKLISHTGTAEFRATKLASIKFPLKLCNIEQIDSKKSLGVQLADILVGGALDATKHIAGLKNNDYSKQIIEHYGDTQLIHFLPDINFKEVKQYRKNSQSSDLIDYIGKIMSTD